MYVGDTVYLVGGQSSLSIYVDTGCTVRHSLLTPQAPCEAEAQCAELCKSGKVYGAGSEDMDTLTFASPVLLRHLTFSEARKMPILEITLSKVLEGRPI